MGPRKLGVLRMRSKRARRRGHVVKRAGRGRSISARAAQSTKHQSILGAAQSLRTRRLAFPRGLSTGSFHCGDVDCTLLHCRSMHQHRALRRKMICAVLVRYPCPLVLPQRISLHHRSRQARENPLDPVLARVHMPACRSWALHQFHHRIVRGI